MHKKYEKKASGEAFSKIITIFYNKVKKGDKRIWESEKDQQRSYFYATNLIRRKEDLNDERIYYVTKQQYVFQNCDDWSLPRYNLRIMQSNQRT